MAELDNLPYSSFQLFQRQKGVSVIPALSIYAFKSHHVNSILSE